MGLLLLFCILSTAKGFSSYEKPPAKHLPFSGHAVLQSPQGSSKFVLILDNSNNMNSCNRFPNMKTFLYQWIAALEVNTKVAIVRFGSTTECSTGDKSFTRGCYVHISDTNNGEAERTFLRQVVDQMSSMGSSHMSEALMKTQSIVEDEFDEHPEESGVVLM